MNQNEPFLISQKGLLENELRKHLRYGDSYAVIDYPDHANVGDCAIWLGEMRLMQEISGRAPAYVASCDHFALEDLLHRYPTGTVFIHGGGNLGDLWLRHQILREEILRRLKGRRVVQLPQSIQFREPSRISDFARLVEAHGDFHVLTRDRRSTEFAQQHFSCEVTLCPDMAFGLGPLMPPQNAMLEVFCLLRSDSEKRDVDDSVLRAIPHSKVGDWLTEPFAYGQRCRLETIPDVLRKGSFDLHTWRWLLYQRLAQGRLDRGLRMLAQGATVLTDRLHAHILSVLMGLPNVVLDNNYGKIHGYMEAWTADAWHTYKVKSPEDALEALSSIHQAKLVADGLRNRGAQH